MSQLEPNWSPEAWLDTAGGTMLLAPGVFNFRKDLHGDLTQLHPAGAPDLRLRQQPATALGHIKNLSKIIEKSSKNPSKIYQNPSKINQKSIKISSWAPRSPKRPQDPSKTLPSPNTGRNIITPPGIILEGFWSHVGPKSY